MNSIAIQHVFNSELLTRLVNRVARGFFYELPLPETATYLILIDPNSSPHISTTGCYRQSDFDLAEAKEKLVDLTAEVARLKEQLKLKDDNQQRSAHAHSDGLKAAPVWNSDSLTLSVPNNKSGSSSSSNSSSKDSNGGACSSSSSGSSGGGISSRFSFELLREMPSIDGKVCRVITMNRTDDAVLLSSYRSISTPAGPLKQYHINRV